jgi:hypothetical protein
MFIHDYFSKYRYFRILEATTHRLIEETKHAKDTIRCRIKLMMKHETEHIVFDELWIEDRLYKVKVTDEENQPVENVKGKQVLYIDVDSEVHYTVEKIFPAEKLDSKIFLGYQVGDRRKYLSIQQPSIRFPKRKSA